MFIDLHMHSSASDGQYTPAELVRKVKDAGIEYLALTDHDTVDGIAEARAEAKRYNLPFIPGIEISTRQGVEIHMLGLSIDETSQALKIACGDYKKERQSRGERICAFLQEKGIAITLEEVIEEAASAPVGRPHFASVLVKKGVVKSRNEAFRRFLETYHFHQATDSALVTPEEAIRIIHESKGKAILAHPGLLKLGRKGQETLILELMEKGLDGIEVFYSGHAHNQKRYYEQLAKEHDLLITAGSDFHGEKVKPSVKPGIKIDEKRIRYELPD